MVQAILGYVIMVGGWEGVCIYWGMLSWLVGRDVHLLGYVIMRGVKG